MRRIGALLGAVVMVVAAFVVRDTVTSDDDQTVGADVDVRPGLVCPIELEELCRGAGGAVTAEPAGTTADRLVEATSAAALGGEAWIVPAAWARLVVAERQRLDREPLFEIDDVIASSAVVLAAWTDQAQELASICGTDAVGWTCIAEQTGQQVLGSRVQPGGPPVDSATGLVVAAAQAGALLGRSDYATNDFTPAFESAATRLAAAESPDPIRVMRIEGPGRYTAVGVVAADARQLDSNFGTIAAFDDREPRVRADVVALVPAGGELDDDRRDALREAFRDAGWETARPGPDGLPDGSVLAAVRTLWKS